MARLDPHERLLRVQEDIVDVSTDAGGDAEVPMETRFKVLESLLVVRTAINELVTLLEPYYVTPPEE